MAMTTQKKTLYVLRHAKAVLAHEAAADHARTLSERGIADATALGHRLAHCAMPVQYVLCSTAARTRQTHAALGLDVPVAFSEKLYLASGAELLQLLCALPDTTESTLLIGHNPSVHELVGALTYDALNARDWERLRVSFPTCALAVLSFTGSWETLAPDSAMLEALL